jgi:putative FmdB family regulatory protein
MPFYEYECSNCKYYTEVLQKVSDPPMAKCPSCGKKTFKKLVSAPVFRLKGSGWYETDFKSDKENKRNLAGAEREEAKADDKKDATAKPEAPKADAGKAEAAKPAAKSTDPKPAARPRRAAAAKAKPAARPKAKPSGRKTRR